MSVVHMERVLVVPTALFKKLGYFQGFSAAVDDYLTELLSAEHTSFRPRSDVEQDPSFKQLIPYVIFRHVDDQGHPWLFRYTRGSGQGEQRLHSKCSVGVGGHISADDVSEGTVGYHEGMRRELEEEVIIDTDSTEQCVGLINDDRTEVGSVHLGVVHLVDVDEPNVAPREPDLLDAGFRPLAEILANIERYESWSQICLEALFSRPNSHSE